MKTKTFDCVKMKHRGAQNIKAQLKDMTTEEELAYWQKRSQVLRQHQEMVKKQSSVVQESQ